MKTPSSLNQQSEETQSRWHWTNFIIAMLCFDSLFFGAFLTLLVSAIEAHERWSGPALGMVTAALGIAAMLQWARQDVISNSVFPFLTKHDHHRSENEKK